MPNKLTIQAVSKAILESEKLIELHYFVYKDKKPVPESYYELANRWRDNIAISQDPRTDTLREI